METGKLQWMESYASFKVQLINPEQGLQLSGRMAALHAEDPRSNPPGSSGMARRDPSLELASYVPNPSSTPSLIFLIPFCMWID